MNRAGFSRRRKIVTSLKGLIPLNYRHPALKRWDMIFRPAKRDLFSGNSNLDTLSAISQEIVRSIS